MKAYTPPASAEMAKLQNEPDALRLLIVQRRMYTSAKRIQAIRWVGLAVLGVGAPFLSILLPGAAVVLGAVTGVWLFIARTFLAWLEARSMTRAACVQEDFDLRVFGMPRTIERGQHPSPEDVAAVAGDAALISETARVQQLRDWYPFTERSPLEAVAIAQRANAAYTDRLIRSVVVVWAAVTIVWIVGLSVWSAAADIALASFLLGVAFPVLPAALDVAEYLRNTWRAAHDRSDLARTIENRLRTEQNRPVEAQDLMVWQERLFELRRTTPQVPDWLYRLTRRRNEAAMRSTAARLP